MTKVVKNGWHQTVKKKAQILTVKEVIVIAKKMKKVLWILNEMSFNSAHIKL